MIPLCLQCWIKHCNNCDVKVNLYYVRTSCVLVTFVGRGCGCLVDGESPGRTFLVKLMYATGHYVVKVKLYYTIVTIFCPAL